MRCPHCKNEYRGRGAKDRLALHLETHEPWTPANEARVAELRAAPEWSYADYTEYRALRRRETAEAARRRRAGARP